MKHYVRILGSIALIGVLAWRLDWAQLADAFAALDGWLWALAVGVYAAAQLVSSVRWQLLAQPLGFRLTYGRYVALYFVGTFFNLVLPTSVGGDVVRVWYLGGRTGRRGAAVLSVLAERGSGLVVLMIMAIAAALLVPTPLPGWMVGVLAAIAAILVVGFASLPLLPLLTRLPVVGEKFVQPVKLVGAYARLPGLLVTATALSVVVHLASVAQLWFVSLGLGLEVTFTYMAVVVPLVTLLTLAPVSVNGMGLREMGLIVLLAPVGVTTAQAVTLSLLGFAVNVAVSLIGAGFYLAGPFPRLSESKGVQDDDCAVRRGSDQRREGQSSAAA